MWELRAKATGRNGTARVVRTAITNLGIVAALFFGLRSQAQIGYPSPKSNFDERFVGSYTLPDLLTTNDGRPVPDARTWFDVRRPEIDRLLTEQEYGKAPGKPPDMKFDVFEKGVPAFDGTAIRKQITIRLSKGEAGPKIELVLYTPAAAKKPVPVLLVLSFTTNANTIEDPGIKPGTVWGPNHQRVSLPPLQASQRGNGIPVQRLLREGYGVATFYYGDAEPDSSAGFPDGIRAQYAKDRGGALADDEWGTIATWAWEMSRAQDYLETDPQADAKHTAIFGVSRLGKTVLWAGAHDPRFALVIASCSGEGGASLSHRNYGETVGDMNRAFAYQFAKNYQKYGADVSKMPIDAHMLVALVAPRPLLLQTGSLDLWSDPKGEFLAEIAADPVYRLLGSKGIESNTWPAPGLPYVSNLGYFMHDGGHGTLPDDWQVFINFLNINLRATLTQ